MIFREISNLPRKVHISRELTNRLPVGNIKAAFDDIVARAVSGKCLNQYLSTDLLKSENKDLLLYDWRIHHLHLGIVSDKGDPRFVSRTDELLYARVEPDSFYCIDILDHSLVDGFSNQKLIQIIHDNWPHLLISYRFSNVPQSAGQLTNEMIYKVREAGATTFISVSDGTSYMPSGGGYASDGSSIQVTRSTDLLLDRLFHLEEAIKNDEKNIRTQIVAAIGGCPRTIKIKLQSWDESGVLTLEKKTNTRFRFPWVS